MSIREITGRLLLKRLSTLIFLFLLPAVVGIFLIIRWRYNGFAGAEMSSFVERIDRKASSIIALNKERAQLIKQFVRLTSNGKLSTSSARSFVISVLDNAVLSGQGDVVGATLCVDGEHYSSSLRLPGISSKVYKLSERIVGEICRGTGGAGKIVLHSGVPNSIVASVTKETLFYSTRTSPKKSHGQMTLAVIYTPSMIDESWISSRFRFKELGITGSYRLSPTPRKSAFSLYHLCTENPLTLVEDRVGRPLIVFGSLGPYRMWSELGFIFLTLIGLILIALLIAIRATKKSLNEALGSIDDLNRDIEKLGKESFGVPLLCEAPEEIASIRKSVEKLRLSILDYGAELKRAESDRQIAETAQMLAHDVRKPLGMAITFSDLLRDAKTKEEVDRIIAAELENLRNAHNQVDSMLSDLSTIGSKVILSPIEVSLKYLIGLALTNVFKNGKHSNAGAIDFSYSLSQRHLLNVDPCKIVRVFTNIVGNASQAMNHHGKIWFRAEELGTGRIELVIGNSGPSIDEEKLPRIFDAFYTTRGRSGGSGLGLAIAKKFVEAHGGQIKCCSLDSGVEFSFTLPISPTQDNDDTILPGSSSDFGVKPGAQEESISALSPIVGDTPLRMLLLDDEPLYRRGITTQISRERLPVNVAEAGSLTEAVSKTARFRPNIIVTDIDLGSQEGNGFDFVKHLRAKGFDGTICVHSNHFLPEDSKEALGSGADIFLPKPLSLPHLIQILKIAIARESRRENPIINEARSGTESVSMEGLRNV